MVGLVGPRVHALIVFCELVEQESWIDLSMVTFPLKKKQNKSKLEALSTQSIVAISDNKSTYYQIPQQLFDT